ncbi:MAG: hypothetical protein FD120_1386 [Gammaproteobacteria bacterium]|nr:MAG: hypothetical protein FD120_1386 [Gammaproteobacteria bacterium]
MNIKGRIALWAAFWLFSILTWLVDASTWMMDWRSTLRLVFAIISFSLGMSLLISKGRTLRSAALVVAGLVVGQWWLIKILVAFALWSVKGFAP